MVQWNGLDARTMLELEQHLCWIGLRTGIYGRTKEGVRIDDARGMIGRVVQRALDYLDMRGVERPSAKAIAQRLGIGQAALSRFLNGRPTGTTPLWHDRGSEALRFLCLGSDSSKADPAGITILERIQLFFFREPAPHNPTPRFFRGIRCWSGNPWSRTELAEVIRWYARQGTLTPGPQLTFVSGAARFLQGDNSQDRRQIFDATHEALAAGVELVFVFPEDTEAEVSVKEFLSQAPSAHRHQISLQGLTQRHPLQHYRCVVPFVQFFFAQYFKAGERQSNLWLVRPWVYESRDIDDQALAIACNPLECQTFADWLEGLLAAKPATPKKPAGKSKGRAVTKKTKAS